MNQEAQEYELAVATGRKAAPPKLLTYEQAAAIVGRTPEAVRKLVADHDIHKYRQVVWPYRALIADSDLSLIANRPMHGRRRRKVDFTRSDGSTVTRVIAMKVEKEEPGTV